jgi:aminopeptidase N
MSIYSIVNKMSRGDVIRDKLVILEGWDTADIGKYLESKNVCKQSYFIDLTKKQIPGNYNEINIDFEGKPQVSKRPPWSGGLSWKRDANNHPLIVTTCQGDGASLWWPCKDHQYDEPDSTLITVTVPENLTDVSNGRLRNAISNPDLTKTFTWFVSSPINNY